MKICFLLGGFYQNGGIGRVTSMLANRLSEDPDFEVITLGYFNPQKPNIYEISESIKQDYFLLIYQSMAKVLLTGGERRLKKYLADNNVDVLIACGALFFPIATRACKGIRTKSICWEHSDPEGNNDHRGQNFARKYGIRRSDLNVVLTKRALRVYREKYKVDNTMQIYNQIDPKVMHIAKGYNQDSKRIISVGRLTYQKNFEAAIEVASHVLPSHPDWDWDIFGMGEDINKLTALVKEKKLDKQMHFKGQVTDLYYRYADYSMMVMTSRYEGFPMTLLEGMGNGLPLISFDIPTGPDEIIVDGVNGYLINAFDTKQMAEHINRIIDDCDLRIRFSFNSIARIASFSEEEIIKEWKTTLLKVIRK